MPPSAELPDHAIPDLSQKLPKLIPRARSKPSRTSPQSTPPPSTPPLPLPPPSGCLTLTKPVRRVLSPEDLELFCQSPTYTLIVSFVFTIADSVRGKTISEVSKHDEALPSSVISLLSILKEAENLVKECPADDTNGSRFGNPAFRTYLSTLASRITEWHATRFSSLPAAALEEITTYFLSSLGSAARIDYGSGHELHFMIYLLCFYQLSQLPESAFPFLALVILPHYLGFMRILQGTYYLEPAGSHGVWGLDDYQFMPFLFGASQLVGHPYLRPMAIHSAPALDAYGDDFLYLDMVRQVNATKTVEGLRWHSPMLDDISGVKGGWEKVYGGLKKMFVGEVLQKLVVMQHFLFGGLVPAVEGMSEDNDNHVELEHEEHMDDAMKALNMSGESPVTHPGHEHNANSWGDCCGIKVPSSIGAVEEMKKRSGTQGLRRLPFD